MQLKGRIVYKVNIAAGYLKSSSGIFRSAVTGFGSLLPQPLKSRIVRTRSFQRAYYHLADAYRRMWPPRTPRVYLKKGISRMEFFATLHKRNVAYVLLRWWENLPHIPPEEDMDILIKDEHRDLIKDLVSFQDTGSGLMCDVYTISGVKYGCRRNLPYFQATLAHTLIDTRVFFKGAYVPSPRLYFASLTYHALFHKGINSGLPGFDSRNSSIEHDYTDILKNQAMKLGIEAEVSVNGLFQWLKEEGFAPADDTLTKLVEHKPELSILEKSLFSDARGGELVVYVIRERLMQDGLINDFKAFLEEKYLFDVIDVRMLNATERDLCRLHIRGGKWDKGPFKYSGGPPCAFVVAYDYHPSPLEEADQKKQIRMTNRNNIESKYVYRNHVKSLFLLKGDYNGIHSADNELDAWSYLSTLGEPYTRGIAAEVEQRRARYARIWGVRKLLSAGPNSKEELIHYNQGIAVKKTFRPGKERYFERELWAVKELSKELSFVPPLLEEGAGYFVIPYFENVLPALTGKDKKSLLATKRKEVVRVVREMHSRGLAYIGFSPENVIVTPDNEFYCWNFEYLQRYDWTPPEVEDAFEVAGLPAHFKGDIPGNFSPGASSFQKVWAPYMGRWNRTAHSQEPA